MHRDSEKKHDIRGTSKCPEANPFVVFYHFGKQQLKLGLLKSIAAFAPTSKIMTS